MIPDYDKDTYGWAFYTAQLLKDKRFNEIDLNNVIQEIESVGNSEEYALINKLRLIISHLLKWQFQPSRRGKSWLNTIKTQRNQSARHLKRNPSLKPKLEEILSESYDDALYMASNETFLDVETFPTECPYTFEQVMDHEFFPED